MKSLIWFALAGAVAASAGDYTALDRYVAAPDPSFRYELSRTTKIPGATVYLVNMVSQKWLTPAEVNRPEWRHWLTIIKPDNLRTSTAVLFVNGGSNNDQPSATADPLTAGIAIEVGAVLAEVDQVPNQPLRFTGENRDRVEDAIIAYTWDKFLRTGDERWPARLPMTKSVVRAMDAVTGFLATDAGGQTQVDRFVLAGGSKRGWTAWTAAALDKRVVALVPLVIDTLNMEQAFIHHWRAYGFWSPAVQDYVDAGIMRWLGTPQLQALMEIEDPFQYRERLAIPKYVVNSAGDEYFLPDSSQFYFTDMPGEKQLLYIPNTEHSLGNLDVTYSLISWLQSFLNCTPRPRFYWRTDRASGVMLLKTIDTPKEVKLWKASNPNARDFRLDAAGVKWESTVLTGENDMYLAYPGKPARGWTAFFMEATFPGPGKFPFKFTTEVVVTPDEYPFPAPTPSSVIPAMLARPRSPLDDTLRLRWDPNISLRDSKSPSGTSERSKSPNGCDCSVK